MKQFIFFLLLTLLTTACATKIDGYKYSGNFEGTEPFWSLEITHGRYILAIDNKKMEGVFEFSAKANRGETFSFKDKNIFGFINRSDNNRCELAITEEDSLSYDIYLNYHQVTYKGCGKLK